MTTIPEFDNESQLLLNPEDNEELEPQDGQTRDVGGKGDTITTKVTTNTHNGSTKKVHLQGKGEKAAEEGFNWVENQGFIDDEKENEGKHSGSSDSYCEIGKAECAVAVTETPPKKTEEDEDDLKKYPAVSFCSLYRYSTCKDIFALIFGGLFALICGFLSPVGNITYGKFAKAMVDQGTAMLYKNHTCPPNTTETTPFMKEVEFFVACQAGLGLTMFLFGYLMVMCYNITSENQVFQLRINYFKCLLRQDIGWFDSCSKRNFSIKIVEDMLKIQTALSEKIPLTIFNLTSFATFFGISFYYGWKLSLVMTSTMPLVIGTVIFQGYVSGKLTTEEQQSYSEAGQVAEECLTNIKTVIAFSGQKKEVERYNIRLEKAKKTSNKKGLLLGLSNGLAWMIYFLNYSIAFWYGTLLVLQSREDHKKHPELPEEYGPDVLVIVLFGIIIGSWSIGSCSEYFESFGAGKGAARAIYPVLNRMPEINSMSDDGFKPTKKAMGDIEFSNVNFAYPTRPDVPVLKNFSLKIEPLSTVAIVGPSGAGKSTIVQLLQRFFDPQEGSVTIDGIDIRQLNVQWLRSQIGIVSQEPVLFNGNIQQNIQLGLKNSSEDEMKTAAIQAYADEFIKKFPNGYQTSTGERGTQLSGGEKQRIAISRALIRNPPILLLDEATAALDNESEAIVQEALHRAKNGRTTIIIAHRLSTIRAANVVVVLKDGQVAEYGNHTELMNQKGLYYDLVNTQEATEATEKKSRELLTQQNVGDDQNVQSELLHILEDSIKSKFDGLSDSPEEAPVQSVTLIEKRKEEESMKKEFKMTQFIKFCLKEWKYMLLSVICTVIKASCLPFYSIIFGNYIALFSSQDNGYIRSQGDIYSLIFLIIALVMGLFSFFQRFFGNLGEYKLTFRMRQKLFKFVLDQDMTFYDDKDNNVGQLTSRLSTDCTSIQGAAGSRLVGLSQAVTIIVLSAVMSFYYLPKMAAVTFVFVPIVLFSSFIEGRVLGDENLTEKESIESAANLAVEALNNIRTVASLGVESYFLEKYHEALLVAHKINLKRAHIRGVVFGFVYSVPYFAYAISVSYGAWLVENECASIADVFKVAEALIFGTMSGGAALAFAPDYDKGKIAAARIMKLFQRNPLIDPNPDFGKIIEKPKGDVKFSNVSFTYPSRPQNQVLNDFNMEAEFGQTIAIVGPSGSGKSTTAGLLMRFYDPNAGSLTFDSLNLKTLNVYHLRSLLGLVSQEPCLFDCTIKENIAYGDNSREVTDEEIISAANLANIHHFISQLPAGYDTRVGSLGSLLSGGQKQRIAIARSLIRKPKVMILDEATSSLDSMSEKIVQTALDTARQARPCLTISIAHRLSSIKHSDLILVLRNGKIVEYGKHEDLLRQQRFYYTMWYIQQEMHT